MCKSHTKKIGALKLSQQDVGKNCIFRGCDFSGLCLDDETTFQKRTKSDKKQMNWGTFEQRNNWGEGSAL